MLVILFVGPNCNRKMINLPLEAPSSPSLSKVVLKLALKFSQEIFRDLKVGWGMECKWTNDQNV
jgi:hypothetical protein